MMIDGEVIARYSHAFKVRGITGMYEEALKDNTVIHNVKQLIKKYESEAFNSGFDPKTKELFIRIIVDLEKTIGGK